MCFNEEWLQLHRESLCGRTALQWVSAAGGFTPLLRSVAGPRHCAITPPAPARSHLKSLLAAGAGVGEGGDGLD